MKLIIYFLLLYVLYRFITRFVIPMVRVTRTANDQLRKMQQRMQDMEQQMQPPAASRKNTEGDYIDYEEVR